MHVFLPFNNTSKDAEFHALSEYILFFASSYFYNQDNVVEQKKCNLDKYDDKGVFTVLEIFSRELV